MFEQVEKLSTGSANNFVAAAAAPSPNPDNNKKKIVIAIAVLILLLVLGAGFWWLWQFLKNKNDGPAQPDNVIASTTPRLDDFHLDGNGDSDVGNNNVAEMDAIEYLYFADFYPELDGSNREFKFADYNLPMNVKVQVANYYDLSRKLDISASLESLNNYGFAVIDNPWGKDTGNFYSLAAALDDKQIPLFISSDFISYYYQSVLKTAFKEVEEGVFYESLWDINRALYESARVRYESHLAAVGNTNDRVLEGERLETAFFAVALELLKPGAAQVDLENKFDSGKFTPQEQQKFSFTVPAYLTEDVLRELSLIRGAKESKKSPVLLYDRDYKSFAVPAEYNNNARLYNFYLTAAWLNSVFPLNYRDETCPECLLDQDDWRVNFIAACLIAQDFTNNQELKNEWARVYKVISFFKGLRDTWNYVDYRDNMKSLFGDDYNIITLFADENSDADNNMEALRQQLLQRVSSPLQGGHNLKTMTGFKNAGLQFLADFYWPNDFIFSSLRYPQVGVYQGGDKPGAGNVTACAVQKIYQRCQGSSQDILSFIYPSWQGETWLENSKYANYQEALGELSPLADEAMRSNLNNYWSSLALWRFYLNTPDEQLPAFLRSSVWRQQMTVSALGAWVDMQMPLDKLVLRSQSSQPVGLSSLVNVPDYAWVEPNLNFFDRLIAHNSMLLSMFEALGVNDRSSLAANNLRDAGQQLSALRAIAEKQARGEDLVADDTQLIRDFARMYSSSQTGDRVLSWQNVALKANIKETLAAPRLLIVAHPAAGQTVFAVSPVFNHKEGR